MKTLEETKKTVEDLASRFDAPSHMLPLFGEQELGKTDIQIQNDEYKYIRRPRFVSTSVEDKLLFSVFADITEHMGLLASIENKINKDDPRRIGYEHQLTLLEKLNPEWKKRREKEIEEELKSLPYNDNYGG